MNKLLTALLAGLLLVVHVTGQTGAEEETHARRAMWHSTRQADGSTFKQLILATLHELASDGSIDERVFGPESRDKRGRYQGFCFQRTASGRYLPYICWKGDRK